MCGRHYEGEGVAIELCEHGVRIADVDAELVRREAPRLEYEGELTPGSRVDRRVVQHLGNVLAGTQDLHLCYAGLDYIDGGASRATRGECEQRDRQAGTQQPAAERLVFGR